MSLRTYSVIVHPELWSGPMQDLARLVAPVAGASSKEVLRLFERGPMTLESDLTEPAARRVSDRLGSLGVPAMIVDDNGKTLDGLEVSVEDMLDSLDGGADIQTDDQLPMPLAPPTRPRKSTQPGLPAAPGSKIAKAPPQEPDDHRGRTLLGTGAAPDEVLKVIQESKNAAARAAEAEFSTPDSPTQDLPPESFSQPAKSEDAGGWANVFPGIEGGQGAALAPAAPPAVVEPADARTVVDTELPEALRLELEGQKEPETKTSSEPDAGGWDGLGFAAAEELIQPATPKPTPQAPRTAPNRDASGLGAALLSDQERRAPYQPTGYDDRGPHNAGMAALLSTIAPGAGQVYNGDDDESMHYAMRFWAVSPWLESIRLARSKGERIATYWAPRPPTTAVLQSIRFVFGFWFCVLGGLSILIFVGNLVYQTATREEVGGRTEAEITSAFDQAKLEGQEARIAALDATSKAREEQKAKFSMSDDERAERLFRLGYQLCQDEQMTECEATMKRVNELKGGSHKGAYRLQTWASMRRASRGKLKSPMPDLGYVGTLEDFELDQFKENDKPPTNRAVDAGSTP